MNVNKHPCGCDKNEYEGKTDINSIYYSAYGKPPTLTWYPDKERQRTVENRIVKLIRRFLYTYGTDSNIIYNY